MKNPITAIFDRDTILHLRIPFSLFLFPIFCFAISQALVVHWMNIAVVFISLHFFIYPGSNAYNSYMDKDKGSIGGLKNPPPATVKLFYASIMVDTVGLLLCLLVNIWLMLFMLLYVLVSKAYSWRGIRLKKYGILSWLIVMFFQGGYTFMMVNMCTENQFNIHWFSEKNVDCMIIASLLIGGFYPLTQIYQHEEDSSRGDYTISYKLGVMGTFAFSAFLFLSACAFSFYYYSSFYEIKHFVIFNVCLLPVILYFLYWSAITLRERSFADFTHSMRMTLVSSLCMIICFSVIFFLNHSL
jgi:1,4-dihydroxy-2-naphthoate octaprenyltransferase